MNVRGTDRQGQTVTDFMELDWKDQATVIQSEQRMFNKIIAEEISDPGRDDYLAVRVLELQTEGMIIASAHYVIVEVPRMQKEGRIQNVTGKSRSHMETNPSK